MVLIISYDLCAPGRNYENLIKRIRQYGSWAKLGQSAFLINTNYSPIQVRDNLMQVLDRNDKLYVGVAPAPAAWSGMPNDVTQWIQSTQR